MTFIKAACSEEDDWQGFSFSSLLLHKRCPLCMQPGFLGQDQWQHLFCGCPAARELAACVGLGFVPLMCRRLGALLALYTASHHPATLVKVVMEHVRMQHRQVQGLGSIEDTCSISTNAFSVIVSACSSDFDFGCVAA